MSEAAHRGADEARSNPTSDGRDVIVLGLSMAAILFLLAQLLDFGYGRDQGIFAAVARAIRDGGAPYRDAWDFKPPGIFFVYALADAVAGPGARAIRILEAIGLLSLVPAFGLLTRVYLDDLRPGVFGAALAILTHVQLEFWQTAQPESFGAVLVAWALLASGVAAERTDLPPNRTAALWLASGVLYGLAALLKPTIGGAGVASLVAGLAAARRRPAVGAAVLRMIGPFAIGMGGTAAACAVVLVSRGAFGDFVEAVFVFAPHYTAVGWSETSLPGLCRQLLSAWLFDYSLLNVVGLLLLFTMPPSPRRMRGALHVGGAIGLLLIGVGIQLKLFPYHFGTVLPLTALVAGVGYWHLWRRLSRTWLGLAAFAGLVLLLISVRSATVQVADGFLRRCALRLTAWTEPARRQEIRDYLYSMADYTAAPNRLAAEWIARETPAGAGVYIWGFTPDIYVTADRPLVSRYIYNVPQRAAWSRDAARLELMRDLARRPPSAVLVENGDRIPMVTGRSTDSAGELAQFEALRSFLTSRYRKVASNAKFDIYTRID